MGAVTFFRSGNCEGVKLTAHAALGTLAALCLTYNTVAFLHRKERHLAVNTLLYGALVAIEIRKCRHHADSGGTRRCRFGLRL